MTSFPDWNELVDRKKVVLAYEFDNFITMARKGVHKDTDTEPDLEVIEQKIDIIDLDDDSDTEQSKDVAIPEQNSKNKTTESEIENIDLTDADGKDIEFLLNMNIPCETPFANPNTPNLVINCENVFLNTESNVESNAQNALDDGILLKSNDVNSNLATIVRLENRNEADAVLEKKNIGKSSTSCVESIEAYDVSSDSDVTEITDIFNSSKVKIETPFFNNSDANLSQSNNFVENVNEKQTEEHERNANSVNYLPKIQNVISIKNDCPSTEITVKNILAQKATELELERSESSKNMSNKLIQKENCAKTIANDVVNDMELLGNFEEIPRNLQFVDDGIVLDDDDKATNNIEEKSTDGNVLPTIDMKLLSLSSVYTKRLDDMDVFKFIEFDNIRDKRIIEQAEIESKPIDLKSMNVDDLRCSNYEGQTVEIKIGPTDPEDKSKEVNTITNTAYPKKKDINNDEDISQTSTKISSDEDDDELIIKKRFDIRNKVFCKPSVLKYNPIQLCKNPDFNTRLKRLTAGFLSYEKNREYLKRCSPVTIDLHKSFEDKLINNTIYLDKENTNICKVPNDGQQSSFSDENTNVNATNDIVDKTSDDVTIVTTACERNKVIHLPDIAEIRRVNENLLTAEVAPLIVMNTSSDEKARNQSILNHQHTEQGNIATDTGNILKATSQTVDDSNPIIVAETVSINDSSHVRDENIDRTTLDINNKNPNKQKIQQKKVPNQGYVPPPWNSRSPYVKADECLLASDTIDKMLAIFSGQNINAKKKKAFTKSKNRPLSLQNDDKERKKQKVSDVSLTICPESNPKNNKISNDNFSDTQNTEDTMAVLSISSKKKRFCCWARKKMSFPNLKRQHTCRRLFCSCCCKELLLEKFKNRKDSAELEQPNLMSTSTLPDTKVPNETTSNNQLLIDESPSKQTLVVAPSIVIDGNTNKINVPKFIIRQRTPLLEPNAVERDVSQVPSAEETNNENTSISGNSSDNTIPTLLKSLLTVPFKPPYTPPPFLHCYESNLKEMKTKSNRKPIVNTYAPHKNNPGSVVIKKKSSTVRLKMKREGKSSSPIYLGPDKILLSTVRGPKAQPIPIDPPKIALPKGVEFVLLPNKELALSVAPGVELEAEQMKHLELVIKALQKVLGPLQLNKDSIVSNNTEASNENFKTVSNDGDNIQIMDSAVRHKELEVIDVSDNTHEPTKDDHRKTILSDLMKMSGISAEDATLPETSVLPTPTIKLPSSNNNLAPTEMNPDLLRLFNNPVAIAALTSRPDLNILTTYSDIRYAIDNYGKFYKMDVCTGKIIQIKVCINKGEEETQINKKTKPLINLEPIDLTSDGESKESDDNLMTTLPKSFIPAKEPLKVYSGDNNAQNSQMDVIKPLKLFKAMHPNILRANTKLTTGTQKVGKSLLKANYLSSRTLRKQNLSQITREDFGDVLIIDQNDSVSVNQNESSSDSDDEPLAKKANRRRVEESTCTTSNPCTSDVEDCEMIADTDESLVYEEIVNELEGPEEDCILGV